jgi:hypothetical protein
VTWSRRRTLVAGLVVLGLTNVVALGGALWNRAGEPEARLALTQRELGRVEPWYGSNRENSGLSLYPVWRILPESTADADVSIWRYAGMGGAPGWLDKAKMESLGFIASAPPEGAERARRRYDKQLAREVLLVLELDGPAYRRSLELVAQRVAREEAKPAPVPGDKAAEARLKNAREALEWETNRNSRLFVVDAGLDAEALRARHPDRARYAIVRGEVRPWLSGARAGHAAGTIDAVSVASINVPLRLRKVFDGAQLSQYDPRGPARFEATVAYGRRLEPWLVDAALK